MISTTGIIKRIKYNNYLKEVETRIRESKLLSPEYDYLEIGEDGYLITPYQIVDSFSFTYDKVEAAGMIAGVDAIKKDNATWNDYFAAVNEVYIKAGRKEKYPGKKLVRRKEL